MRTTRVSWVAALLVLGASVTPAWAQKGMGDATGVARQADKPETVSLAGKVAEIVVGPCKNTTGRAVVGTHFFLESPDGEKLNVHLGPAGAVDFAADQLPVGKEVTVEAFRTEKMPEGHYVAQSLTVDGKMIRLRGDSLAPAWSGGGRPRALLGQPRPAPGYGSGRGPGQGYGSGWAAGYGRQAGRARGAGYGYGAGWGRGAGYGPGRAFVDENRDGVCDRYQRAWGQP